MPKVITKKRKARLGTGLKPVTVVADKLPPLLLWRSIEAVHTDDGQFIADLHRQVIAWQYVDRKIPHHAEVYIDSVKYLADYDEIFFPDEDTPIPNYVHSVSVCFTIGKSAYLTITFPIGLIKNGCDIDIPIEIGFDGWLGYLSKKYPNMNWSLEKVTPVKTAKYDRFSTYRPILAMSAEDILTMPRIMRPGRDNDD